MTESNNSQNGSKSGSCIFDDFDGLPLEDKAAVIVIIIAILLLLVGATI